MAPSSAVGYFLGVNTFSDGAVTDVSLRVRVEVQWGQYVAELVRFRQINLPIFDHGVFARQSGAIRENYLFTDFDMSTCK